jgi:hypothetical protein
LSTSRTIETVLTCDVDVPRLDGPSTIDKVSADGYYIIDDGRDRTFYEPSFIKLITGTKTNADGKSKEILVQRESVVADLY